MKLKENFLIGAATAAHQVEGNNIHSDFWVMEQLEHSDFMEPSLDAVNHYNCYEEDILQLKNAGLNAYRFSIEWARIEPENGKFDDDEIEHYRKVLMCCKENGIGTVVTLHHFSSPKWLITEGGWSADSTVGYFKRYCIYVVERLGNLMNYVCTINEANMSLQMASIVKRILKQMGGNIQVGMSIGNDMQRSQAQKEQAEAFGLNSPEELHPFLGQCTSEMDSVIIRSHEAARNAVKAICPNLKVGLTLSLHDLQGLPGGEEEAQAKWEEEFIHYLPYISKDDFLGIQNYTREVYSAEGIVKASEGAALTQMNYEYYPEGLEHVIRKAAEEFKGELLVTENGIATSDDRQRISFIKTALEGVERCIRDGIPVKGYLYWSLLDNFEWQKGFAITFGLIAVDRSTQTRYPRPSLKYLGSFA